MEGIQVTLSCTILAKLIDALIFTVAFSRVPTSQITSTTVSVKTLGLLIATGPLPGPFFYVDFLV